MKRFYNFLSLLLLSLVGVTASAQSYRAGTEKLASMDEILGKKVFIQTACNGNYMCGTGVSVSSDQLRDDAVYQFEAVEGKTSVDGHPLYVLKQVSTGLYFKDFDIVKPGSDSSDGILPEGSEDLTLTTDKLSEAFEMTVLPFEDITGVEDAQAGPNTASNQKQTLDGVGFVFCRGQKSTGGDYTYLGNLEGGKPVYAPHTGTNAWYIYEAVKETPKAVLLNYVMIYFPSGVSVDVFPVGTNPGYYGEEAVNKAIEVYNRANDMLTATTEYSEKEYMDMAKEVEAAAKAIEASAVKLTEGYYFIKDSRGAGRYWYVETAKNGDLYASSANYAVPETLDANSAKYIWFVAPGTEEGTFTFKNMYSEVYLSDQTATLTSPADQSNAWFVCGNEPVNFKVTDDGQKAKPSFIVATLANQQVNTDAGRGGGLCKWNDKNDDGNCMHFIALADDVIESIREAAVQNALNEKLSAIYDKAVTMKKKNDGSLGLVTSVAQLSSNAAEPTGGEGKLEALVDLDNKTYFHTNWSSPATVEGAHFLQADLQYAVDGVKLDFVRRLRPQGKEDNYPKVADIQVTNNPEGDWVSVGEFEFDYTEDVTYAKGTIGGMQADSLCTAHAGHGTVAFGETYRYIRVIPSKINDDKAYWYLAELHFLPLQDVENAYSQVAEADRTEFEALLAKAADELAAGKATQATITALQASYDKVLAQIPDPARITDLVAEVKKAIESAQEGEEPGYYAEGSIATIQAAVAAAQAAIVPGLTLAQVDQVVATLQAAYAAFHASMVLPEVGQLYLLRSASVATNGAGNAWNSKDAPIYSVNNAKVGALRFTVLNGTAEKAEELSDTIDFDSNMRYLWKVTKATAEGVALQNLGTGMWISAEVEGNNGLMTQSTEESLLKYHLKAPGEFVFEVGEGLYANFQGGGAMVAWNNAYDQNAPIKFESHDAAMLSTDYRWAVTPNVMQVITLPVDIDGVVEAGTVYTVLGLNADRSKILLMENDDEIKAGHPFVYKAPSAPELWEKVGQNMNLAIFYTVQEPSEEFTYVYEGVKGAGFCGTVAETDTIGAQNGYLNENGAFAGVASEQTKAIGVNSGYFTGLLEPANEDDLELVDAEIALGDFALTGISEAQTVILPAQVNVYSIDGKIVRRNVKTGSALRNLPAGVYIMGGQKVLVK